MALMPVVILAPAGHLGLGIAPARQGTADNVWVASVDSNGPLAGRVRQGDIIARVNGIDTKGKDVDFVSGLLLGSAENPSRFLTFLRPAPPSPVTDKENAANQAVTPSNAAAAAPKPSPPSNTVTAPKKPPPPSFTPAAPQKPPTTNVVMGSLQKKPPSVSVSKPGPPAGVDARYRGGALSASPSMVPPQGQPCMMHPYPPGPGGPPPQWLHAHFPPPMSYGMYPYQPVPPKRPLASIAGPPLKKQASRPKKKQKKKAASEMSVEIPEPGFVCKNHKFYSTLNNETLTKVADKLGADWKTIANLPQNTSRYGPLKGNSIFKPGTLLYIPKKRSKWRMKQLTKKEEVETEECMDCGIATNPGEMLMCDGCDATHHVACVGLTAVPEGDWFCSKCLEVLQARAKHHEEEATFELPALPALTLAPEHELQHLKTKLRIYLQNRQTEAFTDLDDYNKATRGSFQVRERELREEVSRIESEIRSNKADYNAAVRVAKRQHGVRGWNLGDWNKVRNWIEIEDDGRAVRLNEREEIVREGSRDYWGRRTGAVMSTRWELALAKRDRVYGDANVKRLSRRMKTLENKLPATKKSLTELHSEAKGLAAIENAEHRRLEVEYASLLEAPLLKNESNVAYKRRELPPRYFGRVHLNDEADVLAVNMLLEPDELILIVPVGHDKDFEPQVGRSYGVFARMSLFDKARDDALPMESNGVRDAQRRLFALLSSNEINKAMLVTHPLIPPTVKLRADDNNSTGCFDLSELVRDCNVDLDLPKEPTPTSMVANGLELRDYQQSSLRWMLDKEKETTGLGLAGELWHRLRFQDPRAAVEYFYCELTGSFALDIFDYRADAEQKDASMNRFAMPTGGVLGEEMGLGKTVIAIALIIQNPPPLHNQVLPREHVWSLEKKTIVDHPAYVPPPNVGESCRLSNGTLVVVPMTLLSQWQAEIERFAPHLRVMTLHNAENPTIQVVASSDVVIASTFLLQKSGATHNKTKSNKGGVSLLRLLKRIHWHRLVVDEAHYNQQGQKTKLVLASLSATHRVSVTGTPIGAQLSDLQGQLRFLRLAPFDRPAFWKNNIEDPYYERSPESLRVLRSLLSRIVVRHSKEQTFENGKSLLSLPARSVETVLLKFGYDAERDVYQGIEERNRNYFMKLKHESLATVASKYLALNGLLSSARQACAHPSLVDVEKLHNFNQMSSDKDIKTQAVDENKTREGILDSALAKARNSAQLRMRVVINQFQSVSELLECPVCLECVGEAEIALPACAHPICSHCISSILDGASSTRDASGHCPTCRDIMRRSEITFLGEATDAGTASKNEERKDDGEEDSKPAAVCSVNGFQVIASNVHVSVRGASTLRAGRSAISDAQLRRTLHEDRALLSTLKEDFLRSYYDCKARVGTKIAELLLEIDAMTRRDPLSKCVVFSQFLGVLDVASEELQARGIGFVRLDGNCKQHERADALLEFSSNPNTKVFLLSMRSGAVGLTLTAADHCFIMDIAQNSAIEEQAIDRIHRIGQTRPVTVKRFAMQDTVEERLLGVRRSLGVDRPEVGTQICGASVLADEETVAAKKKDGLDDAKRQMRVEMLEKLFGCCGKVHKA